ncbi:hypothetical protein HIM_10940 [Hirsutella minnesotensis 3608]|uniref:hAT-like transposase RNase-H fold domain-containing protein n=1 Tax=Hirsutella minnesotensis 3608 TaxID=1043627 RepID=A0A0F7ZWW2_9HYPO|nr:hypothetical protein HIM_10940 [Hirsutella minnesotensis 3608]
MSCPYINSLLQYRLSPYDWKVIEVLVKLLKPFEIATKQLEGNGIPGARSTSGSFDEYLPVFEILVSYSATSREKEDVEIAICDGLDNRTRRLLKVFIKLGWKKMEKYYSRLSGASYVGAVVFNPAKKWHLLDRLWSRIPSRKAKSWRQEYEARLVEIWDRYKEREVDGEIFAASDRGSMDYIERRLARSTAAFPNGQSSPSPAAGARENNRKTMQIASTLQEQTD